jgi:hypothetical protein
VFLAIWFGHSGVVELLDDFFADVARLQAASN